MDDLRELYQQLILDHNQSPKNYRIMLEPDLQAEGHNPLCGDKVEIYLKLDNKDNIVDISFYGSGCAISKASSSIMTTILKGKKKSEAKEIFSDFRNLIMKGKSNRKLPEKLNMLSGVHKFPSRVKCALLSWHAMIQGLDNSSEIVNTEHEKW